MQRKKNIKLLIVLSIAVLVVVVTGVFTAPKNTIDVARNLFSYENTLDINKVTLVGNDNVTLAFQQSNWVVNDTYEADPQRISVLFAILQQVSIRRRVSGRQQDSLKSLFEEQSIEAHFYRQDELVKSFKVIGAEEENLTYMMNDEGIYLVEIPGYRSYLAGIFSLDVNGWRDPLVFDLNWANLADIRVSYPNQPNNDMHVVFDASGLSVAGIEADSLKLGNYVNDISTLYVNDYLNAEELPVITELQGVIEVTDIAGNEFVLHIFDKQSNGQYLVQIDSSDYGWLDQQLVKKVTRPKSYLRSKAGSYTN